MSNLIKEFKIVKRGFLLPYTDNNALTMRMNGDQKERAKKMVAVSSGWVAPALSGALCAALEP